MIDLTSTTTQRNIVFEFTVKNITIPGKIPILENKNLDIFLKNNLDPEKFLIFSQLEFEILFESTPFYNFI